MAKFVLVATSSAEEGRDDEYNKWYDEVHLPDLLSIPGVVSARRFDATPASPFPNPTKYLAIYELETDDPSTVMQALGKGMASGEMKMTDSVDKSSAQLCIWQER